MTTPNAPSLRLLVRGLVIDAQAFKGGVVHLAVGAHKQHKSLWWRLRQHLAHAFFRAGDLCHPCNHHGGLRVVSGHVPATAFDDGLADRADAHVADVWPLHDAFGNAHYNGLFVHEGVKRHHDGRPAVDQEVGLGRKKGADDSHGLSAIWSGLNRTVVVLPDPALTTVQPEAGNAA